MSFDLCGYRFEIVGKMPAVGGGEPSPEQWKRTIAAEKSTYKVLVGAAAVFIGYLVIEKLLS